MSETVEVDLPVPPSANRYWMIARNRLVTTPEAKDYKQLVALMLKNKYEPMRCPIAVNVTVFRPAKRGDLDNYLKVMLDALQGILYVDDKQITEIHAFREDDKNNPHVKFLAYAAYEVESE
jgi:crossover junction endodeoxyribonuclease RusA